MECSTLKINVGLAEREILALVHKYHVQTPPYMAFPTVANPADLNCQLTPPSPPPCQI
jgi:hypothetical protein